MNVKWSISYFPNKIAKITFLHLNIQILRNIVEVIFLFLFVNLAGLYLKYVNLKILTFIKYNNSGRFNSKFILTLPCKPDCFSYLSFLEYIIFLCLCYRRQCFNSQWKVYFKYYLHIVSLVLFFIGLLARREEGKKHFMYWFLRYS